MSSFPHWIILPLLTFLVHFLQHLNPNNPLNTLGPIKCLSYFLFTISLFMSSLPLLFSLNSVVSHCTNFLANTLSLFPLSYYIVLTCLQYWLKSILCLLYACICLVDMTREKHATTLTGFTLCSWSLTLMLPSYYNPTLSDIIISFLLLSP